MLPFCCVEPSLCCADAHGVVSSAVSTSSIVSIVSMDMRFEKGVTDMVYVFLNILTINSFLFSTVPMIDAISAGMEIPIIVIQQW